VADESLKRVVRILQTGRTDRSTESDQELLDRFRNSGDQQAFTALVRRHGKAVLAACRQVLTGPADAADVDDVFQATFLALVKKVKSVDGTTLGGWLYGVAHRLAVRARSDARRRADRETTAAKRARTESPPPDLLWQEAVEILHAELDRLPERYRGVLLLCYLDGQSREEAAANLGCEPGAVRGAWSGAGNCSVCGWPAGASACRSGCWRL
jgi:RNA polymerase sigma factor (sigma-70 family)